MNCPRSACCTGLKSLWSSQMPHNTVQKTQGGCHWTPQLGYTTLRSPLSQSVLCNSTPSCEPPRNHFCTHQSCWTILWSCHSSRHPEPVTASDGKEAFLCVRLQFILAHDHPAGCTSSGCIDGPILHTEDDQLHEINAIFSGGLWAFKPRVVLLLTCFETVVDQG